MSPYPNPDLDGSPVIIGVQGSGTLEVHWTVFTTAFRKVRDERVQFSGSGNIVWDLKDKGGTDVARGLYYLKLDVHSDPGSVKKSFKLLVLR